MFRFEPIQTRFTLLTDEVHGFGVDTEPVQADADAASAALEELYRSLPAAQQAVLAQVLLQAPSAVA